VASSQWQVVSNQNATREVVAVRENFTNEPTDFSPSVVVSHYPRIVCSHSPVTVTKTNEPMFGLRAVCFGDTKTWKARFSERGDQRAVLNHI
jgi:hypothetical protein